MVDAKYLSQGYLVAEDLKLPMILARFILGIAWKLNNMKRMSTVVDGDRAICYHNSSILKGHSQYPNARVETRYTINEEFFRGKIWKK